MITPGKPKKAPVIKTISLHEWLKGRRSDTDPTRTDNGALAISDNVVLEQDGVVRPRPATIPYGAQPLGKIVGIDEFVRIVDGEPQTWLISVQIVGGVGKVFVNKDGGSWQECTGKTYMDARTTFVQGAGKVLILNGKDFMSYLDTISLSVQTYTALSTPTIPTATPTGMSGTALTYRFRITATSKVGETNASVAATVPTSITRDQWSQGGTTPHYVTLSWPAVFGATGYCIYVGIEAGKEKFIGSVPAGTTSFIDDGSAVEIVTKQAPSGNGTQGPIVKRGANVGGQIFLVGDKDNPYHVWYGGTGDDSFDFSPYNGGGWIDIAVGSKNIPIAVVPFRDGKGTPMATVFSNGTNGNGKITHLSLQSTNVGDTVITYMQADEANGQDGTGSPDAIVLSRDALWYPSGSEFKTTGTKPQVQNILSTDNVGDGIIGDMQKLNRASMSLASGVNYNGCLYFAVPSGSSTNNQIWVLDLIRGGQWILPWYIKADKLFLYGSNDGETHFLALVNNRIVEFTRSRNTEDDGVAFGAKAGSGFIKVDKSGAEWVYILDVTFTIINPQGKINLQVQGRTKTSSITSIGTKDFIPQISYAGWGEVKRGANSAVGDIAWGEIVNIPTSYGSTRVVRTVPVKKAVNYFQWLISSSGNADWALSDVVARYVDIGTIITQDMRI
ncbi:MAG TPA: hypothetical protein VJ841_03630 [Candidatus Saccharimonadales bacterium]|nr:hypothetical protein [Candidatus Saccharimonadales bacterium]